MPITIGMKYWFEDKIFKHRDELGGWYTD